MKLDPGIHIAMHSVLSLKPGVAAGGEAQERLAGQREGETLAPEPPRAGVEGVTEAESAPTAPLVEETRVPEPTRAGHFCKC